MNLVKGLFWLSTIVSLSACAGSGSNSDSADVSAPAKKVSLNKYSCPDPSDLRGEGFGPSQDVALQMAQRQIANRVQSTVESNSSLKRVQSENEEGKESVTSSYEVDSKVYSRLENAQAARQVGMEELEGGVGVVACMSLDNAMGPFVQQYNLLQDSILLKSAEYEGTEHPLKKMETFRDAQNAFIRMQSSGNVLESFRYPHEDRGEKSFASLTEKYRQFKSRYAFYYDPSNGGERDVAIFARISQQYRVVAGQCQGGVLLSVNTTEPDCKDGSFGTTCSSMLTLTGTSCYGDTYFVQKTVVKGTGKYGKDEAVGRLVQNIADGEWFALWTKVLDQWNVK